MDKNTTVGKTIRTFLQGTAGIVLALLVIPEFRTFVLANYPQLVVYLPLAVAVFTAIQNGVDKDVPNF